jgi:hypothetical protein
VIPLNEPGAELRRNGFAENFISPNPQFSTIGLRSNANSSIYHAMQTQFTMRPNSGISYQGTFTWGRSMGSPPNGGFAYVPERLEYGLLFGHRLYEFKQNDILEFPMGPGKRRLNFQPVKRTIESFSIPNRNPDSGFFVLKRWSYLQSTRFQIRCSGIMRNQFSTQRNPA